MTYDIANGYKDVPNTRDYVDHYRLWAGEIAQSGGNKSHNNIQPVKAAYAWLRTA